MASPGFVSPWLSGGLAPRTVRSTSGGRPAPAPSSPRRGACMTLDGHEELEVLFDGGDFKSAKYRLDLTIAGEDSRANRKLSIQQIKARGNFAGFRKGTVPPFVMKQVNEFVLRDTIEKEITEAAAELNLKLLQGEAGDPELDFKDLLSKFECSKDFSFSCEIALQTSFDAKAADTASVEAAVDVAAEEVSA